MVVIAAYRDDWPATFDSIRRRLAAILGERAVRSTTSGRHPFPAWTQTDLDRRRGLGGRDRLVTMTPQG
jgi:hypothetical protein